MSLIRGDSVALPLADDSIDLIVTSPPYFALRSYTDGGEHYDGQIGSEPTPQEFLEALWAVTDECRRVLKPSGSMFVNLGDKYVAGTNAKRPATSPAREHGGLASGQAWHESDRRLSAEEAGVRTKSLMGLPWRYAIGCIDQLDLILRAEIVWSKPNGLPESVTDRVRRTHEQWFHFTKEPRYFSAVDEIREPQVQTEWSGRAGCNVPGVESQSSSDGDRHRRVAQQQRSYNPLGKLPGSVWTVPTEPLRIPDHLPQHFAAFPSEWPRRLILGWSPSGICVECGQGRRPVVDKRLRHKQFVSDEHRQRQRVGVDQGRSGRADYYDQLGSTEATITGYACDCPTPTAPTRPARVLDPFAGTGTTIAVANALGRHGIGIDLSADYLKVAAWRCQDPKLRAKTLRVKPPKKQAGGQESLFAA